MSQLPDHPGPQSSTSFTAQRQARPVVSAVLLALAAIAIVRILASYQDKAQAFDEPCHVAAGLEFIGRGTYLLDPVHPPLSRIAIAVPLYLAGERYPSDGPAASSANYNVVGNAILLSSGHYLRNLSLARLGVLPFFLLLLALVFLWARTEFGDTAALLAVALCSTLPILLAFSSIAYSDIVATSTLTAALFAFVTWLKKQDRRSTVLLGIALGLALLSKATTLIFFPAAALGVLLCRRFVRANAEMTLKPRWGRRVVAILMISSLTVWAGYRFSVERVQRSMGISASAIPSFEHFPAPARGLARALVVSNPPIPAPALIHGLATAWVLNQTAPPAYLLGKVRRGGWWYFFLVGVVVKSPLPFLIPVVCGLVSLIPALRQRQWSKLAPIVCALAILVVTMGVRYNAGVRHVLVIFPLLAITAGSGCVSLWEAKRNRHLARSALIVLLTWQAYATVRAQPDFLAYFNELAGADPSKVLVAGCDLDCGQDLLRLAEVLRARHITRPALAIWTSADMEHLGFPEFDVPPPYRPVSGWFAISLRALRFGDLFHTTYPPDSFNWLQEYRPVERIGSTILLYNIPPESAHFKTSTINDSRGVGPQTR